MKRYARKTVGVGLFLLGALNLFLWSAVFEADARPDIAVYFFDVGQGDSAFIESRDGTQILIDGGPTNEVLSSLARVMPFYDRSIDAIILTHPDADHITGLVPLLDHYDIGNIIWNGVTAETKIFQEWNKAVLSEGAEVLVGEYGTRIWMSEMSFFEILHPFRLSGPDLSSEALLRTSASFGEGVAKEDHKKLKQNDLSIVFRLVYGNDTFLFTGDIERGVEHRIVSSGSNLDSDVLKIPHHGSKTSSSELFLLSFISSLNI